MGETHGLIAQALHCVAYVTNGSVRDLPGLKALRFQLFAGSISVTHMYAHIAEYGEPVEIGGLTIAPGDLIHGDRHGVHKIPFEAASEIPAAAQEILREEQEIRRLCESGDFSLERLDEKLRQRAGDGVDVMLDDG